MSCRRDCLRIASSPGDGGGFGPGGHTARAPADDCTSDAWRTKRTSIFWCRMFTQVRATSPNAMLVIAGEGPARESLRRLVTGFGLDADVYFAGYLDRNRAARLLCRRGRVCFRIAHRNPGTGAARGDGAGGAGRLDRRARHALDPQPGCGALVVEEKTGRVRRPASACPGEPGLRGSRSARPGLREDVVLRRDGGPPR